MSTGKFVRGFDCCLTEFVVKLAGRKEEEKLSRSRGSLLCSVLDTAVTVRSLYFQSVGGRGKPTWTAYLLWSTRKRRDMVVDHPEWTFAQMAKWFIDEWKKADADEIDELQKEAEEMNELGIRKLPRDEDVPKLPHHTDIHDTTDKDSDAKDCYRKKSKPNMLINEKEMKVKV